MFCMFQMEKNCLMFVISQLSNIGIILKNPLLVGGLSLYDTIWHVTNSVGFANEYCRLSLTLWTLWLNSDKCRSIYNRVDHSLWNHSLCCFEKNLLPIKNVKWCCDVKSATGKLQDLLHLPPLQESECGSGHGGELWGRPGLHHRENHLCLFSRWGRGAKLQHQPQRGGDDAAVKTWRALSGKKYPQLKLEHRTVLTLLFAVRQVFWKMVTVYRWKQKTKIF